jgi:hypothetical protein
MITGFKLILQTTDSDNVSTEETVQARVGLPHWDPPNVTFNFPSRLSPDLGTATGPYWPVGEHWAFAYCQVRPVPSNYGTGNFFVQSYYNSGNWPNNPTSKFSDTFIGTATTLAASLYNTNVSTISVNSGGGVNPWGFATSTDVSGLRKSIIITNSDLSQADVPWSNQGSNNELIAIYNHNQDQNRFETIKHLETATVNDIPVIWPLGAQVIFHPYHYVPLYQNELEMDSQNVIPRVCVIENGAQFPIRGIFHVSGTSVTGIYSRLLSEVLIPQMAVRFGGDSTWYLVDSLISDTSMTIYDYDRNPLIISGTAEAVPYAMGSGLITVLPYMPNCSDWDVSISPTLYDGDGVPNPSGVVYTANLISVVAGGAPSGTIGYKWEVQPLNGAITTINSSSQISVDYSAGVPIDVRVNVSGSKQPLCIHSDSTGYMTLVKGVNAGSWFVHSTYQLMNEYFSQIRSQDIAGSTIFKILSTNQEPATYFHHQLHFYSPKKALLQNSWNTRTNTISVKKGQIDNWPSSGPFVVTMAVNDVPKQNLLIYGIYSGKQTGTSDDRLTGITISACLRVDWHYQVSLEPNNPNYNFLPDSLIYVPVIGSWPFTFVKNRKSLLSLELENAALIEGRNNSLCSLWFYKPGYPVHTNRWVDRPKHFGASNPNLIQLGQSLPSWIDTGVIVALAPWDSSATGNQELNVVKELWNKGNLAFVQLNPTANRWLTTTDRIDIRAIDYTSRHSTGTLGSLPRCTWLPTQGRLVVPQYNRNQTFVIEYTGYNDNGSTRDDGEEIILHNCRIVEVNGTVPSGYIQTSTWAVPYKELQYNATPYVFTASGLYPSISILCPGTELGDWGIFGTGPVHEYNINNMGRTFGFNAMVVDSIHANRSINPDLRGMNGVALTQPNWEQILPNFPTNGLVAVDSLYRPWPAPETSYYPYHTWQILDWVSYIEYYQQP